jgi:hypothetical protein
VVRETRGVQETDGRRSGVVPTLSAEI